jgi:hypothetical protein
MMMLRRDNPLAKARRDGRPLYYDTQHGVEMPCVLCERAGLTVKHRHPNVFLNDPANSPKDPGSIYTICKGHLPEDAVIYDPISRRCRNKSGDRVQS